MTCFVNLIYEKNFELEVVQEKMPVLLLCMPRSEGFSGEMDVLEAIAREYRAGLKVGFLEEKFLETFKKSYGVIGTPTYLILVKGEEKDRLLGVADQEILAEFVSQSNSDSLT